jgi:hypothetical protein
LRDIDDVGPVEKLVQNARSIFPGRHNDPDASALDRRSLRANRYHGAIKTFVAGTPKLQ